MIVDGANGQNAKPWDYRLDHKGLDLLANAGWPMVLELAFLNHGFAAPKTDLRLPVSKNPMMS
jgi:hypothetical protein